MSPSLLAAAAVVIGAAIAVVSARGSLLVAAGGAVMLAAAPLLADPLPSALEIAERAVGAALAAELLWVGLRGRMAGGTSALPWPTLALLAATAFVIGVAGHQVAAGTGPPEALGAALALFTIAVVAATGRADGVQYALVGFVVVAATGVVRTALGGPLSPLESLLVAALGVGVAACVSLLVASTPTPAVLAPAAASPSRRGAPGVVADVVRGEASAPSGRRPSKPSEPVLAPQPGRPGGPAQPGRPAQPGDPAQGRPPARPSRPDPREAR